MEPRREIKRLSLVELLDLNEPAWPLVLEWIAAAKNQAEILPRPGVEARETALLAAQVTTRSPMGAIIYESGGILVDHGWIRILGAGHSRLPRSLPEWNLSRGIDLARGAPPFLLVADDAVGGFFAIDGGGLAIERGMICYLAPDTLRWENTHCGYSQFVVWCLDGELGVYYKNHRWANWRAEVEQLRGDQAIGFYPPLWSAGPPMGERLRSAVAIGEIFDLSRDNRC